MATNKVDWKRVNETIKIQKSLIKNGKTPHIRDMARHRLKLIKEKVKAYGTQQSISR